VYIIRQRGCLHTYEAWKYKAVILNANDFGILPPFVIEARLTVVLVAGDEGNSPIFIDTDAACCTYF